MSDEDKNDLANTTIIVKLGNLTDKIDRKALAGAVGIMLLSWAGLPLVYMLLHRKRKLGVKKENEHKN